MVTDKSAQVKLKKSTRWKDRWIVLRQEGLAVYKTKSEYELLHMYKLTQLVACLHTPFAKRPNVLVLVFQQSPLTQPLAQQDDEISPRQKTILINVDIKQRSLMEDFILTMAHFRAIANTNLDVLSWHSLLPAKILDTVVDSVPTTDDTHVTIPTMSNCQRLGFVCTSRPSFDADWWYTSARDMLVPYQQTEMESLSENVTTDELQTVPESPDEEEEESEEEPEDEDLPVPVKKEKSDDKLHDLVDAPLRVGYLYKKKNRAGLTTSRKNTIKLQAEVVPGSVRSTGALGIKTDLESPRTSTSAASKSILDHDPSYHTRYFVLRGSKLTWYQDAREYEVLKILDMKDVTWIKLDLKMRGATSLDNAAVSSDEETVDESDDEFTHSAQAKTLVSKLKNASVVSTPTSAKSIKLKKGKSISIAFGMGVSSLSVISTQSNNVPTTPSSPVNVVVKQVAMPVSQNALMEISVVRPGISARPKQVKMMAREWSSGIGILDEILQTENTSKQSLHPLQETLWTSFAKMTSDDIDSKRIKAQANDDVFLGVMSKYLQQPGVNVSNIPAAWQAFLSALNAPIKPLPSNPVSPTADHDPSNKTTEELIQKSVVALQKFQSPINELQKPTRLYQIRLVTSKRDYVLATESVTEFVKWTIALRRSWISSRI